MEHIKLNLIPESNVTPICHASQYDKGRVIRIDLFEGKYPYILSDETVELDVRKGDGNVITTELTVVEGANYVDMITTVQMCAIQGNNPCELKISKGDTELYSKNFVLKVEGSVLEGGIESDSEIHNLETQIAGLVETAVENQYDSENVIFDSTPTAGHGNGYAVTSAGLKTAIDAKADASATAAALALKADKTDLELKADKDGEYDQLTAGLAKQLKSNVGENDKEPYNFRTSGGTIDIGDREEDTIVGGTVAFNQLAPILNSTNYSYDSSTVSFSDGVVSSSNPTARFAGVRMRNITTSRAENGDKILLSADVKIGWNGKPISVYYNNGTRQDGFSGMSKPDYAQNVWHNLACIIPIVRVEASTNGKMLLQDDNTDYSGHEWQAKNMQWFNLTQMFGSTVADYIYSLETQTAGAGVAWFRKLFPKSYYAYNAGELISVKTSAHITRGFNAWDEEWELGAFDANGQPVPTENAIRSKNFIPVLPNTTYYFKCGSNVSNSPFEYDADKNFIKRVGYVVNQTFTTSADTHFLKIGMPTSYGTTYNHDICINLSWDGERDGEYEPYVEHEYPLDSDLELRGIPKLDANNKLYYDGDTYESDGSVTRKYGIIDLGSLNWYSTPTDQGQFGNRFRSEPISNIKDTGDARAIANLICSKYDAVSNQNTYDGKRGLAVHQSEKTLNIYDVTFSSGYTGAQVKTALSGVYVVVELETTVAETADPFTNPQLVDDFGTEEYVDNRAVPIPVGHDTMYQANLRAKLEMAPDSPNGNGDYIVRQTNGANEYVPLVIPAELPTAPTTDGNYRLKCTVSNGTPTYSWEAVT